MTKENYTKKEVQDLLDVSFKMIILAWSGEVKSTDREVVMKWAADNFRVMGFDTIPMGLSWGVLK